MAAGRGKRSPTPETDSLAPQDKGAAQVDERGPVVPHFAVSMVSVDPGRGHDHPPRNSDPMASIRFSALLALEVAEASWPAKNR